MIKSMNKSYFIFQIYLLRELWEEQKEEKSVEDFCSENNISKSFFYTYIGSESEALKFKIKIPRRR